MRPKSLRIVTFPKATRGADVPPPTPPENARNMLTQDERDIVDAYRALSDLQRRAYRWEIRIDAHQNIARRIKQQNGGGE